MNEIILTILYVNDEIDDHDVDDDDDDGDDIFDDDARDDNNVGKNDDCCNVQKFKSSFNCDVDR